MRLLDRFRTAQREAGDTGELRTLADRLNRACQGAEEARRRLCEAAVMRALGRPVAPASPITDLSTRLCEALLASEGLFLPVRLDGSLTTAEVWKLTDDIKHRLSVFEAPEPFIATLAGFLSNLFGGLPSLPVPEDGTALSIPLFDFLPNLPLAVEGLAITFNGPQAACPFQALTSRLERNLMIASGVDPSDRTSREQPVPPTKAKDQSPQALIENYLGGTPFAAFLQTPIPFSIPLRARYVLTKAEPRLTCSGFAASPPSKTCAWPSTPSRTATTRPGSSSATATRPPPPSGQRSSRRSQKRHETANAVSHYR
jgi:hypothetical protein